VVTPFKDRWDLLETFLHWYEHVWGVRTVCVLMGYTQPHHLQSTLQRLQTVGAFRGWTARSLGGRRLSGSHTLSAGLLEGAMWYESVVNENDAQQEDGRGWRVYVLAYRTSQHTAHDTQWRPLFRELNALVHAQLPAQLDRIMAVDSDEYLCVRTTRSPPRKCLVAPGGALCLKSLSLANPALNFQCLLSPGHPTRVAGWIGCADEHNLWYSINLWQIDSLEVDVEFFNC
jgi:hypothetical protein